MACPGLCDVCAKCSVLLLGDREAVPGHRRKISQSLGLKFRGAGAVAIFWKLIKQVPSTPDEQEVFFMIRMGEQATALIEDVKKVACLPILMPGKLFVEKLRSIGEMLEKPCGRHAI